jgi:hypothetical protein
MHLFLAGQQLTWPEAAGKLEIHSVAQRSRRTMEDFPQHWRTTGTLTYRAGHTQICYRTRGGVWISEAPSKYPGGSYGTEVIAARQGWTAFRYGLAITRHTMGKATQGATPHGPRSTIRFRSHIILLVSVGEDTSVFTCQATTRYRCPRSWYWNQVGGF